MSPHPRLGPLAAAAELLQCHPRTVRRMVSRGELAGYRVGAGRMIRVDLNEVDQLLQRIPTVEGAA